LITQLHIACLTQPTSLPAKTAEKQSGLYGSAATQNNHPFSNAAIAATKTRGNTVETTSAIQEYSKTEAALAELNQRHAGVVYEVATTSGMALAKAARAEVRGYRTSLEATRKEIKAPALERCKMIDDEAKRITAELLKLEEPIDEQIKAEEKRKEAIKEAEAEKERERVTYIRDLITLITGLPSALAGKPSADIVDAINNLAASEITLDEYQEFSGEAMQAKAAALNALAELHAAAVAQEEEQERIAAERAELERLRAEAAERERIAQEEWLKQEAAARAEREAHEAAMRAEREAQEASLRAQQAELDRQRLEIEAERAAQERAERERQEAARKEREAREKAEADERARIAAEQDAKEQALLDEQRRLEEAQEALDRELAEQAARAAHACRNDGEAYMAVDVVNAISGSLGVSHQRAVELVIMAADELNQRKAA